MKIKIQPKKKTQWAILLILISIPLSYYGFSNLEEGASEPLQAILISLACTGGVSCLIGGIYMFFTKEKGRGEDLLASQTKVGDSPILDKDKIRQRNQAAIDNLVTKTTDNAIKTLTKKQKVNEMAEAKDTVANTVKEVRELEEDLVQSEEIIKKETLNAKATTEKIAVLKHNLAKDKTVKELLAIVTDYQLKQ